MIITAQVLLIVAFFSIMLTIITDINECTSYNGGCNQTCSNTPGSYSCSCNSGYVLNIDEHNCTGQ